MAESAEDKPYNFLNDKDIIAALLASEGSDAKFQGYKIKDFSKKGDNYLGVLTSIIVSFNIADVNKETSFIVKATLSNSASTSSFTKYIFDKEVGFYTKVVPQLNTELEKIGDIPLRFPKCYFECVRGGEKILYMEDLRCSSYVLFDRKKSFDAKHCTLVVNELARLHSASALVMKRKEFADIHKSFPDLQEPFSALKKESSNIKYDEFFRNFVEAGKWIAEASSEHEKVAKFFEQKMLVAYKEFFDQQLPSSRNLTAFCHGDSWINNCLFRSVYTFIFLFHKCLISNC